MAAWGAELHILVGEKLMSIGGFFVEMVQSGALLVAMPHWPSPPFKFARYVTDN